MKTLALYIDEAFRINKDTKVDKYNYHPKTKDELKKLIKKLIDERGKDADLNDIDVSEITDMAFLFNHVQMLAHNIDISEWDVSNVTNMSGMFCDNKSFNCDLSKWDVNNVRDMGEMFKGCDSLQNIPVWFR